ncbi:DUF2384 domain-containing protein [Pseudomonas sp. UL073]|uniref:DUF2384 domain-containing protein n=1 Tax=Zestomonas insulae TaxID=2809017 RepID=A0ABS2I9M2_9GAMM|nr:DUF2384 domain-containing protein [Pseudomonas insulae]
MVELKPYRPVVPEAPSYWRHIGIPPQGAELIQQVRRGFDYAVLVRLAESSGFTTQRLATMAGLSGYAVRQARRRGKWSLLNSDRLFRVACVLHAAQDLFGGDWGPARHWLGAPQLGLGGGRPVDWLLTEVESRMVLDLIERINHGVAT